MLLDVSRTDGTTNCARSSGSILDPNGWACVRLAGISEGICLRYIGPRNGMTLGGRSNVTLGAVLLSCACYRVIYVLGCIFAIRSHDVVNA